MTEPCDLSAVEARRLIGRKRLSAVELVESCIARIEMVNPAVNAVVARDYDRAREAARVATQAVMRGDELPALHGLPVGIKDMNHTEGLTTTYGSPIYRDFVPAADERFVAALRQAGGIILAKTNTPEFAAGGNTTNKVFGATRNPFDLARTSGGSSGGSAAALATGMLPLCSGSDTGGSLRRPATYCGVAALRPSIGLIPSDRRTVPLTTFSTLGPMARTVADLGLMLSAMAGEDTIDPMSFPNDPAQFRDIAPADLSRVRVAVSEDLGFAPVAKAIRRTFRETLAVYGSAFASCDDHDPPMENAADIFWILRGLQFVATQKHHYDTERDRLGANVLFNTEAGLAMSMEQAGWAHKEHGELYRRFQRYFDQYDVLICPGVPVPAFPLDQPAPSEIDGVKMAHYISASAITAGLTLTGHPVVALPCGLDHTGAPFGIQVVGRKHRDRFTLSVAMALEQLFSGTPALARPVPDLDYLAGR